MRKVLISANTACALATSAQAADDMLPTDEAREAAPIGLVGEPWPPGSELGASNFTMQQPVPYPNDSANKAALREKLTTFAGGDLPAPPVNPGGPPKGSQGAAAAAENKGAGRPFWQLAPALVFEQMKTREPVSVPHGPFRVAVDPDVTIVPSKWPLVLVPREYSAQASVPLANCPQPDAADDEALCQPH